MANATFEVETIKNGFQLPYSDTEYEYHIKSNQPQQVVERFCTEFLQKCKAYMGDERNNPFEAYYNFGINEDGTYYYKVTKPFCD